LAYTAAVAPRFILLLAWIFSDRWPLVWKDEWLLPLLGILFLPYTTIMYLLTWTLLGGIEGWDWMWIILGLFLDVMKWTQIIANRKQAVATAQQYYPSGAARVSTSASVIDAAVSGGQLPPSTSPTAPDADTAPTAATPPPEAPRDERGEG
jgi:hypothetical protein